MIDEKYDRVRVRIGWIFDTMWIYQKKCMRLYMMPISLFVSSLGFTIIGIVLQLEIFSYIINRLKYGNMTQENARDHSWLFIPNMKMLEIIHEFFDNI